MDYSKIDNNKLNDAIKALNNFVDGDGNLYIGSKIKFVASTKENRVTNFTKAYEDLVNKIYDEDDPLDIELPDVVTEFYTELYPEVGDEGGENTESAPSPPPPDPDPKKKKSTPKKQTGAKKTTGERRGPSEVKAFLSEKIEEAKWTRKQITDKAVAKFPEKSKATISTYISDGFSEKYCPFPKLIVKTKEDILKFGKKV